jgi:hypothetical protein
MPSAQWPFVHSAPALHGSGVQPDAVAYFWQAPAPSHSPFCWQLGEPSSLHSASGSVPVAIGAQLPSGAPVLACTHASHTPVHAALQQTLSAQLPVEH